MTGGTTLTAAMPSLTTRGTLNSVVVTNAESSGDDGTGTLSRGFQLDFNDVTTSTFGYSEITTLARNSVTLGCATAGNFCPSQDVYRYQMAAFLLRGEQGLKYVPPPAQYTMFTDVTSATPLASSIESIASEGVMSACGTSLFCPNSYVSRSDMAVFVLKSKNGASYVPSTPYQGIFADVLSTTPNALYIEELYREGITTGCTTVPFNYCPSDNVDRSHMAVFIVRTFNLQ